MPMALKTNKAIQSRMRKTRGGSLVTSGKGRGHFNAKHARTKKLRQKRERELTLPEKTKQRYLLA